MCVDDIPLKIMMLGRGDSQTPPRSDLAVLEVPTKFWGPSMILEIQVGWVKRYHTRRWN